MNKKTFETNASVHFILDDWEFECHQSRANPDGKWYLYHYSFSKGDEQLGIVSNPFDRYEEFLLDAGIVARAWIKRNKG